MRSSKPTLKKKSADPAAVKNFIEAADKDPIADAELPWKAPGVRPDMTKLFNLRLPEDVYLKLKYLSENQRRRSMQTICMDAIEPAIDAKIEALLGKR